MRLAIIGSLVATFSLLAVPLPSQAQPAEDVHRLGYLSLGRGVPPTVFIEELHRHGFSEGKNLAIEYRLAGGRHDLMRGLAADLVHQNVEAILAVGDEAIVAAMAETKTIPIVMVACDALAVGFVSNLARPGGNVAGLTCISTEISPKRVGIFKELLPDLSRLAVLYNAENVAKPFDARATRSTAEDLGIEVTTLPIREAEDLEPAFAQAAANGAGGIIVLSEAFTLLHAKLIADLALKYRLPDMHVFRESVDAGGLISFGPNVKDMLRLTAKSVAKVLRGEEPGGIPVEQPAKFDFVVNLQRAKALGLTVPPAILARADEVIE